MATDKRLIDVNHYDRILYEREMQLMRHYGSISGAIKGCRDLLAQENTVDATEVVHAEWIDIRFDPMWRSMSATCSHCKVRGEVRVKSNECGFAVPDSNHCPNCGARMDGDGNG